MRVGRLPQHARGAAQGQRRAGRCRTRASASTRDGQIMVSGVTMLGYLGDAPRRAGRGVGDRRPRRNRRRRLRVRARPPAQHLHHQLRPQRLARVGRARDRAAIPASATCWCTARRGHTRSRSSARNRDGADAATIDRAIAAANARAAGLRAGAPLDARDRAFLASTNGLLTSNGRLRRREIVQRHGALLDALYRERNRILNEVNDEFPRATRSRDCG